MDRLTALFGSEARARLVVHFVVYPESRLGARALGRHVGIPGKRSLQIELDRLAALGLLERQRSGREVIVARNPDHAGWKALSVLVQEYAPMLVLRDVLRGVPGVRAAFVFGSFARGEPRPDSDIDLLVFGDDVPNQALGGALFDASVVLDHRIDVKRYDTESFRRDAQPGASFLPGALAGPKLWLLGSASDLPGTRRAAA